MIQKKLKIDQVTDIDFNYFIEHTEVVFDYNDYFSIIFHTYDQKGRPGGYDGPTFIGTNKWLKVKDSRDEFDLKADYYKFLLSNNMSMGLMELKSPEGYKWFLPSKSGFEIFEYFNSKITFFNNELKSQSGIYNYKLYFLGFIVACALLTIIVLLK